MMTFNSSNNGPRLAFSTLGCPDWGWEDVLQKGIGYGFHGVEIRMLRGETDLLQVPEFHPNQWPQRRQDLSDAGLVLCGLASSVHLHDLDSNTAASQLETARRYVEMCAGLGAGFLRVFGDVLPPREDFPSRQTVLSLIADRLRELGEFSTSYGVQILLETHGDFLQSDTLAGLMEKVRHPQVGVLWDTHHPWRFEGEAPEKTAVRLAPWIRHTHWKDSVDSAGPKDKTEAEIAAEAAARRLMSGHRDAGYVSFGEGDFPARNCLTALRSCGYEGWYCLEWEKAWHPEIEEARTIFPAFVNRFQRLWDSLSIPQG